MKKSFKNRPINNLARLQTYFQSRKEKNLDLNWLEH